MAKQGRPGAAKNNKRKHQNRVGTGGHGRQALEGRGPTPKAEDRPYHPKAKAKARAERTGRAGGRGAGRGAGGRDGSYRDGNYRDGGYRDGGYAKRSGSGRKPAAKRSSGEVVSGRNPVVEALRAKVPAEAFYMASNIDSDDRVREAVSLATKRGIPIMEVTKPDLDRLTSEGFAHQGMALKVPEYKYAHPDDLIADAKAAPLIVALDGITDPRNLGAIIRSVSAFGGDGVVVPQRRSVGMTASAWKTSAGAAARVPVAMANNLTSALKAYKAAGLFVIGLDGGGDVDLPKLELADRPLVVVVGSEGKGISRLVREQCDAIVSIPIDSAMESLNASVATSIALYAIAQKRLA